MTLQIEVGKYYRDGEGNVVGPMQLSGDPGFPWVGYLTYPCPFTQLASRDHIYTSTGLWSLGPSQYDLICEVARLAPGAPWVDVSPCMAGLEKLANTAGDVWGSSPPPTHNCYSAGHVWVDTGTLRSWCRHCQANAEWSREHAMFFPTGKHEVT